MVFGPYLVTQRGVRSLDIFTDDADRSLYVEFMRDECGSQGNRRGSSGDTMLIHGDSIARRSAPVKLLSS